MDNYVTGNTIRKLREAQSMTQAQLAEIIGVSDKAISKWETGRGYPDITLIETLAEALKVSVAELLSGHQIINRNISANMKRSKLYVCPICGNVIVATGEAQISCCGITLPPLEGENADDAHGITQERVEDETFVTIDHEMTKDHYISFIAYVTENNFQLIKLYPEGNPEARFKFRGRGKLFAYCNRHGLNMYDTEAKQRWGNTKEYKEFEHKTADKTPAEMDAYGADLMTKFTELGKLRKDCFTAESKEVQAKVDELRKYICEHYYECSKEVFSSLGDMYVADERFKDNIDQAGGRGTAAFAQKAIKKYCE